MKREVEAIESVTARLATVARNEDEANGAAAGVFAARIISELMRGRSKPLDDRLRALEQAFYLRANALSAASLPRKPRGKGGGRKGR